MILKGEKVILRDWETSDIEIFQYWNTGKHKWMEFDGPYYPKMNTAELQERSKKILEGIERGGWPSPRRRLVIADGITNKFIGTVSWYWQSEETNWMSIGIAIYDEKDWDKKFGTDAFKLWIDYLFKSNLNLARLDIRTWSGNKGMMKLAEKLGFTLEAKFRKARIVNGEFYDSIGMGILREEWERVKQF